MKRLVHPITLSGLLIAVWSIPWTIYGASTVFQGQRYFFLADDPTISMRYGRNLARGLGLVWNPGERVEGYSNFLWTLYMGLIHLLPLSNATTALPIILTNIALAILGGAFVYKIARKLVDAPIFAALAVATYALNGDTFEWMLRGFETSLLATLLLAAFYFVQCDLETGRPRISTHVLIISLSLVRIDALLLSGLLILWALYASPDRKRVFLLSAASMAVPAAHIAFRWVYYDDLLPNTAYLKVFGFAGRVASGLRWVARFYVTYLFSAVLMGVALWKLRSGAMKAAAAICFLFTAYVAYAGGDIFVGFRFLAPIIPLVILVSLFAAWQLTGPEGEERLESAAQRVLGNRGVAMALAGLGAAVFVAAAYAWQPLSQHSLVRASVVCLAGATALSAAAFAAARLLKKRVRFAAWMTSRSLNPARIALLAGIVAQTPVLLWTHRVPAPVNVSYVDNIHIGMFLHDHTPADATIADSWAGLTPYFSERRSIDLPGEMRPKDCP